MMCLLSATTTAGGGSNSSASFVAGKYSEIPPDSPSSSSSDSSSNPSPPQLSPQIRNGCLNKEAPIYLDLNNHRNNKENEEPLVSPPMALLTPQLHSNTVEQIFPEEPKVVISQESSSEEVIENKRENNENTVEIVPERKKVPLTFCNMRQNIFDLKKKRGRKPKEWIKNNINPTANSSTKFHSEFSSNQQSTNTNGTAEAYNLLVNNYGTIRKRKISNRAESVDDPYYLGSKSLKLESQFDDIIPRRRRASAHPELKIEEKLSVYDFEDEIVSHYEDSDRISDSDDSDFKLQIDDEEDEEDLDHENDENVDSKELVKSLISSLLKRTFQTVDLSVPLTDMFQNTPLNCYKCIGCTKEYSYQDSICVDLKCQTMHVTCSQCSWWTYRRIGIASKQY